MSYIFVILPPFNSRFHGQWFPRVIYQLFRSDLQKEFKVKIDDVKDKTDIDIKHGNGVTEAEIKADLHIKIRLPKSYLFKVDFSGQTEVLLIHDIELENIEYDGKATDVILDSIS